MKQLLFVLAVAACSKAEATGPQTIKLDKVGLSIQSPAPAKIVENTDAEILHLGVGTELKIKSLKSSLTITVLNKPQTLAHTKEVHPKAQVIAEEQIADGFTVRYANEKKSFVVPFGATVYREIGDKHVECAAYCDTEDACVKLVDACKTLRQ